MPTDQHSLQPGERIAGFTIERVLGVGGFGEVYSAHDAARSCAVALKLLPRATIARRPDFVQPFQREYHRLQLLRHPRIVEVYQYGSDARGLYYTMELLDGPDLRCQLPLPWRQTCSVLRDIALSLAIVHSRRLVHRDVGPGNVRLDRDGRAKLLDFGATVSLGFVCDVVGTPPCIAPEALEYAPLDARADLFGLGALGYYLLTGVHAYPAGGLSQLPGLWEKPLPAASARAPELPKALELLLGALLQRDRRLRPRSATEVINHLEAIADLPPLSAAEAAQTSFVAPALVGRSPEMHLLCCHLAAARKGRGAPLLLEGTPGQGRTRLLRQLVVEASQPDVLVIEVGANRGLPRSSEGCLELCEAVLRQLPELSPHELDAQGTTWAALLEALRRNAGASAMAPVGEPQRTLHMTLANALLSLTARVTLVVLADDVHTYDEPSALLLAQLARRAPEHPLLLVTTKQLGSPVRAAHALQTLTKHAERWLLKPLSARAVEELVRSAFVDAPQVKFVSEWVFSLSEGNAAKLVELLRYLVEHDLVQFRDGAWVLPEHLDPSLLPCDVAAALRDRLRALPASVRELAELLALCVRPASMDDLRALYAQEREPSEASSALLSALDELSAADLIAVDGRWVSISRPSVREVLQKGMNAEQLRAAHARVGRALSREFASAAYDTSVDLATAYQWAVSGYHLLLGAERQQGVSLWMNAVRYTFEVDCVPIWDGNLWYLEGNLLALAAAEELGLPRLLIASLRTAVVQSALHPDPRLAVHGEETLRELERGAGLHDYLAAAEGGAPGQRIASAVKLALERWTQDPDAGVHPSSARKLLVGMSLGLAFIYGHTLSVRELGALPEKLNPFIPIMPACAAFKLLIEAIHANVSGRTQRELDTRLLGLDALESPEMQKLVTHTLRQHLRGCWLYTIATLEAVRDPAAGLRRVSQMETETPFMTFGAWQVRLLAHICECNAVEAQACAERMEMASVQDVQIAKNQLHASGLQPLAAAYALSGDIVGLKSVIDKLEPFLDSLPTWQPIYDAARAQYQRLRGRLETARTLVTRAARSVAAGEHRAYGFVTLTWLRVALEQEDLEAAHTKASDALARTRALSLGPELEAQLCALDAHALAQLGSFGAAREQAACAEACAERARFSGLLLGDIHHDLAHVALLARDADAFERHASLVAKHTCTFEHPVLLARYKRLLGAARDSGLTYSATRAGTGVLTGSTDLRAQLLAELKRRSVARSLPERVLELMVERAGVSAGYLFGLEQDTLQLIAPADAEVPAGLFDALETCLAAEQAVATLGAQQSMTATRTSVVRLETGQLFQVAVLHLADDTGSLRAAGAIALGVHDELPAIPRWDCVQALWTVLDAEQEACG